MLKAKFTYQQQEIVKEICDIQIQSLLRLSMKNKVKKYLNEMGLYISDEEIAENVSEMIRQFDMLKLKPNCLLSLDDVYLSLVKHILTNYDEEFSSFDLVDHKRNLWVKLNINDNFKTPMN